MWIRYACTRASGGDGRTWRVLRRVSILKKLAFTRLTKPAGAGAGSRDVRPPLRVYESRSIYK
jgi:hypothetical protein